MFVLFKCNLLVTRRLVLWVVYHVTDEKKHLSSVLGWVRQDRCYLNAEPLLPYLRERLMIQARSGTDWRQFLQLFTCSCICSPPRATLMQHRTALCLVTSLWVMIHVSPGAPHHVPFSLWNLVSNILCFFLRNFNRNTNKN